MDAGDEGHKHIASYAAVSRRAQGCEAPGWVCGHQGYPAPWGGRGEAQLCRLPAPFCFLAPRCGQWPALPGFAPRQGQTRQPRASSASVLVHFFTSGVGRAGGARAGLDGDL